MVKLMNLKLEEDSTLKDCKFQDLNSTDEEKHPLEFSNVERQKKAKKIRKQKMVHKLDPQNRVLRERKIFKASLKLKNDCSSTLTTNMERRVKKQGKYSSLETLSMRMLKQKGIYAASKTLAKINEIGEQKNYCIIALRLGLLYHHETTKVGIDKQKVIQWIYEYLAQSLEKCIHQKYINNNSEAFVQQIKNKNLRDLAVFKKALSTDFSNFELINQKIQGLYEKKNNGCPSMKNQKFCQKVTHVLMGTALYGSNFRLDSKRKEIDLLDEIQFPSNTDDRIIQLEKHLEESIFEQNFQQFYPLDACIQNLADLDEVFNFIHPQQMNTFPRRQSSTMARLQYYHSDNYFCQNVFLVE